MNDLNDWDWIQIDQAARGCVSGSSDEWPDLVVAIQKVLGTKLQYRRTSDWLRGFCEALVLQRERLLEKKAEEGR